MNSIGRPTRTAWRPPSSRVAVLLAAALAAVALLFGAPRVASATTSVASPHGRLQAECSLCHGSNGWRPARISKAFDHAKFGFRLDGAHRAAACTACHKSLEFEKADAQCSSCHLDPHRGELGVACERCHTAKSFLDRAAMARMHQETRLPLIGAHRAADCQQCHVPQSAGRLQFVGLPAACQSCHLANYNATSNPAHAASGFPLDCERCHRPLSWNGAAFDHANTGFPLTGAHRGVACATCHVGGVYAGTSAACASCHQADYNGATNPNHALAGFPTTCATCHNTSNWNGAFTQHDALYFPIYSGAHRGRWSACADCHDQPTNFASFNCLGCHLKTQADGQHTGVNGYQYASAACYSCHPQGRN